MKLVDEMKKTQKNETWIIPLFYHVLMDLFKKLLNILLSLYLCVVDFSFLCVKKKLTMNFKSFIRGSILSNDCFTAVSNSYILIKFRNDNILLNY